jgi:hypothetical protein
MYTDEMGSYTQRLMREREQINIISLDSSESRGGPGMMYCPTCPNNKLLSKYADTDDKVFCERREAGSGWPASGCGKIFNIEDFVEDEEPIEQQYGRNGQNTKPIIASQPGREKQKPGRPSDIPSNASYEEQDFNP